MDIDARLRVEQSIGKSDEEVAKAILFEDDFAPADVHCSFMDCDGCPPMPSYLSTLAGA